MNDSPTALRVVVADDQELVRAGFVLILERAGMIVVGEAADGVEAVEVGLASRPDVILMDVRMPRRTGSRRPGCCWTGCPPPRSWR